eukprot:2410726-Rhodomonas_salina.1
MAYHMEHEALGQCQKELGRVLGERERTMHSVIADVLREASAGHCVRWYIGEKKLATLSKCHQSWRWCKGRDEAQQELCQKRTSISECVAGERMSDIAEQMQGLRPAARTLE